MIPIRDDAPRSITPYITYFLLAINIAVFIFELALGGGRTDFLYEFGLTPTRFLNAFRSGGAGVAAIVPLFTSLFLHAGWMHLIANMWALWIFGDNLEDHLGHFGFLLFYMVNGVAASLVHVLFNQQSPVPSVGASGAIAGVMGAYFLLFPAARVLTVMPFVFIFVWLPAWVVLGYWFLAQFVSGAADALTRAGVTSGGVAFWAHVGGFIVGVTLIKLMPAREGGFRYPR